MSDIKEMLCIPSGGRGYAVEFPYIEEMCRGVKLSCLPCVPDYFAGVCNFKGNIVPVIYLDGKPPVSGSEQDRQIVIMIRHDKFYMGILIDQEPFLTKVTGEDSIQGPDRPGEGLWMEKQYYVCGGKLYALIDVEKSIEKLVICE